SIYKVSSFPVLSFFFFRLPRPPRSSLFPYTTLFRSFKTHSFDPRLGHTVAIPGYPWKYNNAIIYQESGSRAPFQYGYFNSMKEQDRKSTRLNSSHVKISYAVFCLKKKKQEIKYCQRH